MKVGDLVQVKPAMSGYYIVVGEDEEKENNWPGRDGIPLGRLWELYDSEDSSVKPMHEKWIEVIE